MRLLLLFVLMPFFIWSEVRILILGDSNTHGLPSKEYSWVTLLKEEYKDSPHVKFLNYGLGMATAEQCEMLYHIACDLHDPDIVFYTAGLVNVVFRYDLDAGLIPSITRTIQKCVDDKRLVFFGMIDYTSFIKKFNIQKVYIDKANKIYGDIAETFHEYITPFIFLDNNLLMNPKYNSGDGLHPNLAGQKVIALRAKHVLDDYIYLPFDLLRETRHKLIEDNTVFQ